MGPREAKSVEGGKTWSTASGGAGGGGWPPPLARMRETGISVQTGRFQQHMLVEIHNDGPVTILLDSQDRLKPRHG